MTGYKYFESVISSHILVEEIEESVKAANRVIKKRYGYYLKKKLFKVPRIVEMVRGEIYPYIVDQFFYEGTWDRRVARDIFNGYYPHHLLFGETDETQFDHYEVLLDKKNQNLSIDELNKRLTIYRHQNADSFRLDGFSRAVCQDILVINEMFTKDTKIKKHINKQLHSFLSTYTFNEHLDESFIKRYETFHHENSFSTGSLFKFASTRLKKEARWMNEVLIKNFDDLNNDVELKKPKEIDPFITSDFEEKLEVLVKWLKMNNLIGKDIFKEKITQISIYPELQKMNPELFKAKGEGKADLCRDLFKIAAEREYCFSKYNPKL